MKLTAPSRILPAWTRTEAAAWDGWLAAGVAMLLRCTVVLWAAHRFPPAADGRFYQVVAERIALGFGYTWLWPDGAVTHAAHYPVGYPAMMAALYAVFGSEAWVAMLMNAVVGSLAVVCAHRLAARAASRLGAMLATWVVAVHPSLVLYTSALMTEGIVAALLVCLAWLAVTVRDATTGQRRWRVVILGLALGCVTMIRPQCLLLAPILGGITVSGGSPHVWRKLIVNAVLVTGLTVAVCVPWTLRNCSRMGRCTFVSANAGWNLLIGSGPGATGAWVPIEVAGLPDECRLVFAEAEKDACFGRAGWRRVTEQPLRWIALMPRKLSATFDTAAIASGYLAESNPRAMPHDRKVALGGLETIWQRLVVLLGLVALARARGPRFRCRIVIGVLAGLGLLAQTAWPSTLAIVALALCLGRSLIDHPQACIAAGAVLLTAATHATFFGADRYAMVCFGVLGALAGGVMPRLDGARGEA